jgi:hypothetical protein
LEEQLNMYCQQWQADQQKQIIAKMAGKMPGKTNEGKRKNSERNHHNSSGARQGNISRGGRGGRGRGRGGRGNNSEHLKKMLNVSIVAKRVTILPTAQLQEKVTMNIQTWYPSRISKTYFNLH